MAYAIPLGGLIPYVGTSAPNSSFALPYGQAISRTAYATLFGLVGTTFGNGDGSTTFNIPDLRGRAVFGLDNMGGTPALRITVTGGNYDGTTLGNAGGAQNHALTTGEMPNHSHGITDPGHRHAADSGTGFIYNGANAGAVTAGGAYTFDNQTASATTRITINNAGSGNAHTIMPPSIVLPFILRVI